MSALVDVGASSGEPPKTVVVIPNWDGAADLPACLDSLLAQTTPAHIIVVDNGSTDNSVTLVETAYPQVELIRHDSNRGYAGGVNPGFRRAIELGATYAAPFNNDAVADRRWLERLEAELDAHPELGIACCKVASADGSHLDSTGDQYTTWGLPYPRGRGESDRGQYDDYDHRTILAASGAASLFRVRMLKQIGLFDEDFFAYYEDVDISLRAQLRGWQIAYVARSVVRHETSTTGSRIKGFFTYQTMKNLPMLLVKNVPNRLLTTVLPRFTLVYCSFFVSALQRRQLGYALRGAGRALWLAPRKLAERGRIQRGRTASDDYIASMLTWDLPPNAAKLRALRSKWWQLVGKAEKKGKSNG